MSSASASGDDSDDCVMFSLLDGDDDAGILGDTEVSSADEAASLSRRMSQGLQLKGEEEAGGNNNSGDKADGASEARRGVKSVRLMKREKAVKSVQKSEKSERPRRLKLAPGLSANWKNAFDKISQMTDPWEEYHLEAYPTERAKRYRYNATTRQWKIDECLVKIEPQPFNAGAMRQCYRMKKLSTSSHHDWSHGGPNYVAKSYFEDVEREVYFEDVKLQMEAKRWGEFYNRCNPPKKVDIFQMCVIEFEDREGQPLYHLEHFIEGEYNKYNSNQGFVDDVHARRTPHAFSHFTFERSGHKLIIIDIQGVGDLYTDPQIHTCDGLGFGDGNLGSRGMALFFHSHVCNEICRELQLSHFDLARSEVLHQRNSASCLKKYSHTEVRSPVKPDGYSSSPTDGSGGNPFFRQRSAASTSSVELRSKEPGECFSFPPLRGAMSLESESSGVPPAFTPMTSVDETPPSSAPVSPLDGPRPPRQRYQSSCGSESGTSLFTEEEERNWREKQLIQHRSSSVFTNAQLQQDLIQRQTANSILAQIHHELARYHEMGRFKREERAEAQEKKKEQPTDNEHNEADTDEDVDWAAVLFHEQHAATLGHRDALMNLAKVYLALPHTALAGVTIPESEGTEEKGVEYMEQAAELGHLAAMVFMAKAYETGQQLGPDRERNWQEALHWYGETVEGHRGAEDATATPDATPLFDLLASQAALLRQGGSGLAKDPSRAGDLYNEAAEEAMGAMNGRRANKYYMLAEECYGEVEEEEEEE